MLAPADHLAAQCAVAVALALVAGSCCPGPRTTAARSTTSAAAPGEIATIRTPRAVRAETHDTMTEAQFRNVDFHVGPGIVLHIARLRGEMRSMDAGGPVVFDDKRSFLIRIDSAEVGLSMQSLDHLLNDHVFGYAGAPLRHLRFSTANGRLVQRGVLHKVVDIPFEITATMSITPAGLIRIHPVTMKIFNVSGKGLLSAIGLQLADLLDLKQAVGVSVSGNDLFLDPEKILPPPAIEGRVTAVRVTRDEVVQTFGESGTARKRLGPLAPPDSSAPNYMYFQGGTLRFGKLFMVQADMQISDLDPRDPFEFSIDDYNRQLVAGYSKNTPDHGLTVFMPDIDQVEQASAGRDSTRHE
jgi:hypothetical protein